MLLLILESLGSTELLFILVMALVFFGPRKLPQLSRSLGKGLAEFRRASEDFKRTWEKEVNLEEATAVDVRSNENSIYQENASAPLELPAIEAVTPERVVPREPATSTTDAADIDKLDDSPAETSRKSEWL